jgi:hypothetical protein
MAVPPFRLLKGSKSRDILGENLQVSQQYFCPFPLDEEDVYAVLVLNYLVLTVASPVGFLRGLGFFLYRGCLSVKSRSGTGRSEA